VDSARFSSARLPLFFCRIAEGETASAQAAGKAAE